MRKALVVLASSAVLIGSGIGYANAQSDSDVTCASFTTQQEAQTYFDSHPLATNLDEDADGKACEDLPASVDTTTPTTTAVDTTTTTVPTAITTPETTTTTPKETSTTTVDPTTSTSTTTKESDPTTIIKTQDNNSVAIITGNQVTEVPIGSAQTGSA